MSTQTFKVREGLNSGMRYRHDPDNPCVCNYGRIPAHRRVAKADRGDDCLFVLRGTHWWVPRAGELGQRLGIDFGSLAAGGHGAHTQKL
jgi:hypothetical protein